MLKKKKKRIGKLFTHLFGGITLLKLIRNQFAFAFFVLFFLMVPICQLRCNNKKILFSCHTAY
jgi:hypothetical protein